jgi:small-conductance mechanosensitive channel
MENITARKIYSIILVIIAFSVLAFIISIFSFIPPEYKEIIYMLIILVTGVMIVNLLSDIIEIRVSGKNKQVSNTLIFVTRLAGYIIVIAIALSSFRIGITSILLGGGFAGVVIGLAAQTSLSNFFSGIVLLFSRPFNIGDNITISTWQYGLIAPSYPPKFFSDDFLVPGYTGVVEKMNLTFTTIRLENNIPIKIPNSIVLQASIFINNEKNRNVKVRYEVPSNVDPDTFILQAKKEISKLEFVADEPSIFISETSFANKSNVFSVSVLCQSESVDFPRSEIIKKLISVADSLQHAKSTKKK